MNLVILVVLALAALVGLRHVQDCHPEWELVAGTAFGLAMIVLLTLAVLTS